MPSENKSLINLEPLRELMENDQAGMREILDLVIEETPKAISEMQNQHQHQQWDQLRHTIHSIKLHYSYVGCTSLFNLLNEWENSLKRGDGKNESSILPEIETKTKQIIIEIKSILKHGVL